MTAHDGELPQKWNKVASALISSGTISFTHTSPSARAKKGLGMVLTVTLIVVLALLLYGFWEWLWQIATFLALALLLYVAWPWLSQMRWDDTLMSWCSKLACRKRWRAARRADGRMCRGNARPSRTIDSKSSARRAIRVRIRDRLFATRTGKERISSFGRDGAGLCLTATSRTDTCVFLIKNSSGAGRYRHMLLRCHAGTIKVTGGAGEQRSVTATMADRSGA